MIKLVVEPHLRSVCMIVSYVVLLKTTYIIHFFLKLDSKSVLSPLMFIMK